jgi:hypothetical protein
MSDFPRGWTLTNWPGTNFTAAIVVAAVPGVVHVLDAFYYRIIQLTGAATTVALQLSSSDGLFAAQYLGALTLTAATNTMDSDSDSGLDLAPGPGASLTVQGSGPIPGVAQFLRIHGHDI